MKITLYMAISIDGFIAKKDGNSDWVSPLDSVNFQQKIEEKGCLIVGRKTFDQYIGDLYPVKNITNIVVTSNSSLKSKENNVFYVHTPIEAIQTGEKNGHKEALLIGGGTTNGLFLKSGLIDDIFLSVHPLILGSGIKLFENIETNIKLKLIDQRELGEGLIQLHYQVTK